MQLAALGIGLGHPLSEGQHSCGAGWQLVTGDGDTVSSPGTVAVSETRSLEDVLYFYAGLPGAEHGTSTGQALCPSPELPKPYLSVCEAQRNTERRNRQTASVVFKCQGQGDWERTI